MKHFILAVLCAGLLSGAAGADGDPAKGEMIFKTCVACHAVADKSNKLGPHLVGIIDRTVASVEGYKYSNAMKEFAASGGVWNDTTLAAFIENPKAIVPNSKMAFSGIKKEEQRKDLIAFLKAKSEAGLSASDAATPAATSSTPPSSQLILPAVDSKRGRALYVSKGCVACHAINGIGGTDGAPLDAASMDPAMNPFEFFARMWLGSKPMISLQEERMGKQAELDAQELADIVAFIHDQEMQRAFSAEEIPKDIKKLFD
jgi:cytochrome c2